MEFKGAPVDEIERAMTQDRQIIERSVLHSVILGGNRALRGVVEELPDGADSFADSNHVLVFRAMIALYERDAAVEINALTCEIGKLSVRGIDATALLADVTRGDVPTSTNACEYARQLHEANIKEHLARSLRAAEIACRNGETPAAILETLRAEIGDLDIGATSSTLPMPVDLSCFDQPAPKREFVFDGMFARSTVTLVAACGGRSKSWLSWLWIISAATGRALLPSFVPARMMRVVVVAAEDDAAEFHRRFQSVVEVYRLSEFEIAAFKSNVTLYAGRGFPLVELDEKSKSPKSTAAYRELQAVIVKDEPDLIVVDPAALFHAVDENSNPHMAAVIDAFAGLTRETPSYPALVLLHHTNKVDGDKVTRHAARGASALHDGVRAMFQLTELSDENMVDWGLADKSLYVKLTAIKSNYSPLMAQPFVFMREAGGCLLEIDVARAKEDARINILNNGAQVIADALGSDSGWTAREISEPSRANDKEQAWQVRESINEELKTCGLKHTNVAIKKYIKHGIAARLLKETRVLTGARPRFEICKTTNSRNNAQ